MAAQLRVILGCLAVTQPCLSVWVSDGTVRGTDWGYGESNGPATWAESFPESCAGEAQSPIDLPSTATVMNPGEVKMIGYNLAMEGNVTNNGHSLVFTFTKGSTPYIHGGRLPEGETFSFAQLHWHWGSDSSQGSEHTMAGKEYPMEIHLVHVNNKYASLTDAVGYSDGLAVLGFFYEVSDTDNDQLADILSVASKVRRRSFAKSRKSKKYREACEAGCLPEWTKEERYTCKQECKNGDRAASNTVEVGAKIMLDQLVPTDTTDYYYYQGGLTTPTCNEVVLWTNFMSPVPVSESQLAVFRGMVDTSGGSLSDNYRPPQPLNGRTVYATKAPTTTDTALGGIDFIGAAGGLLGAGALALALTAGVAAVPLFLPPPPPQARAHVNLRAGQERWAQGGLWG